MFANPGCICPDSVSVIIQRTSVTYSPATKPRADTFSDVFADGVNGDPAQSVQVEFKFVLYRIITLTGDEYAPVEICDNSISSGIKSVISILSNGTLPVLPILVRKNRAVWPTE